MSSTTQLLDQLNAISNNLKSTQQLIHRLSTLSFQPGSEPLDSSETNNVRLELAQDIHDSLKQLEEDLELLSQEAEDLNVVVHASRRRDSELNRDRARLAAQIARLTEDLKTSRSQFRRAQLNAKKASQQAKAKERELLFASLQNPPPEEDQGKGDLFAARRHKPQNQKQLTKEELEVDASSNVTAALRRTHDLLSTELSRSRFAQETFDQSTAALADLGEKYSSLDDILGKSRTLLSTLVRSQKSDTWYLETAFYILVGTLVWLFFRRILVGPLYLLPRFFVRWFIWPVVSTLFSLVGYTVKTGSSLLQPQSGLTSTRTPLIVQPSATRGSQPRFPPGMSHGPNIPAGGGGMGAKLGPEERLKGMSGEIGKMAEDSEEAAKGEQVQRADGTVLEDAPEVQRNPKKRMFEAEIEDKKEEERKMEKDEL